jgi:quercetin dioxygenase-like cupin family protein
MLQAHNRVGEPRKTAKGVMVMLVSGKGHVVGPGEGRTVDLGVACMRVLADSDTVPGGSFALTEFYGAGAGPWTVPHVHRGFEESFFILDGAFSFTIGESVTEATPGMYLLVPRDTQHGISAAAGGGRFLTLMVPGGLEKMFFELAALPPNAIRDPVARAAISARFDSIPV